MTIIVRIIIIKIVIMENEIIFSSNFIRYIKSDVYGNPIKVLFKFELLHNYGYTIVYNLYTKGFMAYDSTKPLAPHLKPVVSGEVPYSVLQTFKPQIDERDMGSHGTFKKQNKIRNRTIQI